MNTAAGIVLVLLVLILWRNYRAGTLRDWFAAKFLNIKAGS